MVYEAKRNGLDEDDIFELKNDIAKRKLKTGKNTPKNTNLTELVLMKQRRQSHDMRKR